MTFGSIQVPASGQPIVMMADSPTTGGYSKIGNVISADLPLLAQCVPGKSKIRFQETTVAKAQKKYRDLMNGMKKSIMQLEENDAWFI
jgi:allophanate hydrolase subunit 2